MKSTTKSRTRVLIVRAPYYAEILQEMLRGASAAVEQAGATWEQLDVPGALEIPAAITFAAASGKYDAFVALGCVMKGETIHYEIVGWEASRAIMDLTLKGLCIGNGILTVENQKQAWARANVVEQDIGGGAARAALALLAHKRRLTPVKTSGTKRK